jgi:hypothetical protein
LGATPPPTIYYRAKSGYMGVSSSLILICGGCLDMWRFLFGSVVARPAIISICGGPQGG